MLWAGCELRCLTVRCVLFSAAPDQPRPPVWESAPFEEAPRQPAIFRTIHNAPGAAGGQSVTHALPTAGGQPLLPAAGPGTAYGLPGGHGLPAGNPGYAPAGVAPAGPQRPLPAGLAGSVPAPAPAPAPVVHVPMLVNTNLPPPAIFPSPAAAAAAPAPAKERPAAPAPAPAPAAAPATNAVDKFTQEFIQSNHRSLYGGRRETSEHSSSHSRERSPQRSSSHHHRSSRDRSSHERRYERDYERDYDRDYDSRSSRQVTTARRLRPPPAEAAAAASIRGPLLAPMMLTSAVLLCGLACFVADFCSRLCLIVTYFVFTAALVCIVANSNS